MTAQPPLIYDIGMNNGDDCAYYLAKGYRVVAIEANPILCDFVRLRFKAEIAAQRLIVLNTGIAGEPGQLPFYVHRSNSVLSTFQPPGERVGYTATLPDDQFVVIIAPVQRLSDIIGRYGSPEYIKIDIEGYDLQCLADLAANQIAPRYLSAEAHTLDVFGYFEAMQYVSFKLTAGRTVAQEFAYCKITTLDGGAKVYSFNEHSSGPFGEDIPGPWLEREAALTAWINRPPGWFDLHAMRTISAD